MNMNPEFWHYQDGYVCIRVEALEISIRVGLYEEEKKSPQRVIVDLALFAAPSYLEDAVDAASVINYASVVEKILAWESRGHVDLLETLAQELLDMAFSYEAVQAARVSVKKPDVIAQAHAVGVAAMRVRHQT